MNTPSVTASKQYFIYFSTSMKKILDGNVLMATPSNMKRNNFQNANRVELNIRFEESIISVLKSPISKAT